jgi:hypothetical protein
MLYIQVQALPAQTFQVVLDGQECTISLYQRVGRMFLDLAVGDVGIRKGAICQHNADVIQSESRFFSGNLRWLDTRGQRPPEWQGIGDRFFLVYDNG